MLAERVGGFEGSYYRGFLSPLFFQGFALPEADRPSDVRDMLGRVPYLNGGIFQKHHIEELHGQTIEVPNEAFQRLFGFFDDYRWHLDERPLVAGNEINPDVLGYIFEKYVNQKQMGAYYTKEDITEYISRNSIAPFLLDTARSECRVAFENPEGPTVWDLLKDTPERYVHPALRHGTGEPLPDDIAAGLDPPTLHTIVSNDPVETLEIRKRWNKPAPEKFALPTETWREVVSRRVRHKDILARLAAGQVRDSSDLVTLNLDIRQFLQDAIENCEGPDLLRAFWRAIEKVTILDPTCGSGAFLFAALGILEPLYEACLDQMQTLIEDVDRLGDTHAIDRLPDFRKTLARVAAHPNRRYFVLKSIILNNLFGVDIMEEAVEICRLRLFLKLAAAVEPDSRHPNLGVEPLPDIDFNIRAGNSLVGFGTYQDAECVVSQKLDFDDAMPRIAARAGELQQAFDAFRSAQVEGNGKVPTETKHELQSRLSALDKELDRYMASDQGVNPANRDEYTRWLTAHQPFHWFVEFYGIMNDGGFDVIVGNPPYVECTRAGIEYKVSVVSTIPCDNLWAFVLERSIALLRHRGRVSLITPLSLIASARFGPAYRLLVSECSYVSFLALSGDAHPSVLFPEVKMSFTIFTAAKAERADVSSTVMISKLYRWLSDERSALFPLVQYQPSLPVSGIGVPFKVGASLGVQALLRMTSKRETIGDLERKKGTPLLYHRIVRHFVKAFLTAPYFRNDRDGEKKSDDYKTILLENPTSANIARAFLVSSAFYLWFVALSDAYHCGRELVLAFPVAISTFPDRLRDEAVQWGIYHEEDLRKHSVRRKIKYRATGWIEYDEFYPRESKPIADEIDHLLAQHYGLTEEELDFIINYDIKYRLGSDTEQE